MPPPPQNNWLRGWHPQRCAQLITQACNYEARLLGGGLAVRTIEILGFHRV